MVDLGNAEYKKAINLGGTRVISLGRHLPLRASVYKIEVLDEYDKSVVIRFTAMEGGNNGEKA